MAKNVLVAYATKYGSTKEIAEEIAAVIEEKGFGVELLPADKAGDITAYNAVVLGSAVYIGMWRKGAAKFLKHNAKTLAERKVWLFSSGPTGEGDPVKLMNGWKFPQSLKEVADKIAPRDIVLFNGRVEMEGMSGLDKWILKNVKALVGDFRDWDAVREWALSIAGSL